VLRKGWQFLLTMILLYWSQRGKAFFCNIDIKIYLSNRNLSMSLIHFNLIMYNLICVHADFVIVVSRNSTGQSRINNPDTCNF